MKRFVVFFDQVISREELMRIPGVYDARFAYEEPFEKEYCWAIWLRNGMNEDSHVRLLRLGMVEYFEDDLSYLTREKVWRKRTTRSIL
jgi:hypothetical protein